MNPTNVTINELADGYSVCERVNPLDPNVIAALSSAVTSQRVVNKISAPVNARTIDGTAFANGVENQVEFTFTNNTALTIIYWFTGLFNEAGDDTNFGIAGESAFDYPAAQGSGNTVEGGGGDLKVFNKYVIATGGLIIGRVEVTTSTAGSQRNQNLIINRYSISRDQCASRRIAPLCPACPTDEGNLTRTILFKCPIAVGGPMSFGYPVLAGQEVTVRLTVIGEAVSQYKDLGSDCACS